MSWDDVGDPTSTDNLTPPHGLEGFQPRWTRDGRYWFFEQDRWQVFAQPKGGAPHDPPFSVVSKPRRDNYVTSIQESPEGLDGFIWVRTTSGPERSYWYKSINGWRVYAEPPYPHTSPAPQVWAPPFTLQEPAMSQPLATGDGVLNFGMVPNFADRAAGSFLTNDTDLGRVAMGAESATSSESPAGGLLDGWFSRNYVVKDPTLVGAATLVVVALAFFAGRIRRAA